MSQLGQKVANRRRDLGMTRSELGERIAMTARQIETIETAQVSLKVELVPRYCEALGIVDVSVIFKEDAFW